MKTLIKTNIDPKNPDTTIVVGDVVRSHDFPDRIEFPDPKRGDAYIEGVVTKIAPHAQNPSCDSYHINMTKRVWGENVDNISHDEIMFAPVNGTPKVGGGVTFGVEKIVGNIKCELPIEQWCQILDVLGKSEEFNFDDFAAIVDDVRDQVRDGHVAD